MRKKKREAKRTGIMVEYKDHESMWGRMSPVMEESS